MKNGYEGEKVTITTALAVRHASGEVTIDTHTCVVTAEQARDIFATYQPGEEGRDLGFFVTDRWRGASAASDKARRIMTRRQGGVR